MIKENQKLLNRLNVLTDAAAAFIAVAAAYLLVFSLLDFERNYPLADYFRLLLIFVPVQLVTYGCMGLYGSFRSKSFSTEFGKLFGAFLLDGLALIALLYVARIMNFSRWALAIFLLLDFLLVTLKRYVLRKTLRKFRENGYNRKSVLLVGSGTAAEDYLRTIREQRWLGYECCGCIAQSPLPGVKMLGGIDSLLGVLENRSYDEVVCALGADENNSLPRVVEACELTGTKISVIPSIYKYMSSSPAIDVVGNIPLMNIRRIPLDNIGNAALKRITDIVGSLVLLLVTSPVILASMAVIKATIGGKVIFRQKRVGLNKKVFTMYKLKSMRDSGESDTAWSKQSDPRRTKFGSFIRKFSIDELPQLVNVLKGDMSLVGPRPEIPFYVNDFKDKIPMYMIKHQVKPGITGLAQINGYRGDTSIEKRIEYDVQYIENWSFFLDVSILLRTAFSGFMNKEKLSSRKRKPKPYKAEKLNMSNNKAKTDLVALVMFLPSIIAAALVPVIVHINAVVTDLRETFVYHAGTELYSDGVTQYRFIEGYSQGKALAVIVLALIMIAMALLCCLSLFRRIEKRSLVYVGCSAVFVAMTLASAAMSKYSSIAFAGEYDRAEGFWTTACYFVLFLFTMYAFRTSGNFRFLMYGLFFCVGVNFILGVFQVAGQDLLHQDWFINIISDSSVRGHIEGNLSDGGALAQGALYHSNYMGSFTGMIIPLFTVMAMYSEKKPHRVLFIVFDAMAVFLLIGSTARSGIVAVAAALVAGIVVFARQIAKHWKRCAIVAAAGAVAVVGLNFAAGNKLFARVPSLVKDAVGMFLPADGENTDLFSKLPLREISTPADGTLVLTGQETAMTVAYDNEKLKYTFTDSDGNPVNTNSIYEFTDGLTDVIINADYSKGIFDVTAGDAKGRLTLDSSGILTAAGDTSLFAPKGSDYAIIDKGYGVFFIKTGGSSMYAEYDPEIEQLLFTDGDSEDYEERISAFETIRFPESTFSDVSLLTHSSVSGSPVKDAIALYFYQKTNDPLLFTLKNQKKIQMISLRTEDAIIPENAEHIGFEGKEKLGSSRGYIWSRTLPLLKNCLITGYGADTFTYNFPQNDVLAKYYSYTDYGTTGFYMTVDKPHNLYLQIFFSNGLIAFIAFIAICVFYLADCCRLYALKKEYRPEQIMGAAVMLAVVGYLAAGMFNDSTVSVAPVFWILLGAGAALNTINRRMDRNVAIDEDYTPVMEKPAPTPEETEKDRQVAAAGEILAAAIRGEQQRKAEERAQEIRNRTITKDDIAGLLKSVQAMKSAGDIEREQPQKPEDSSDDNG